MTYLISKLTERNVLFKVSKKTDPQRRSRAAFSVVRISDDPELLSRFCTSYVQSQESDLISKLCRKTKEGVDESSNEELSTPEKNVKGKVDDETKRDTIDAVNLDGFLDRGKNVHPGLESSDAKVKRRLDDEFSTSKIKCKQSAVVVKKEKP